MFQIHRVEEENPVLRQNCIRTENGTELEYLTFPLLEETGIVRHLFSTRLGGVSGDEFASMNFSVDRGDRKENVMKNYGRIAEVLGCSVGDMTASHQTHTTNIRRMGPEDRGKGITSARDYENVDGLLTDEPGLVLVTFYADCVPLYFVDPVNRAVGLSHSGWRGTVNRMGEKTLQAMNKAFGTRPEDVTVCIGPSICKNCFEVGEEVVEEFQKNFARKDWESLWAKNGKPGKYQLDLWKANAVILEEAGVCRDRITVTNLCTRCNAEYLFSHRKCGENRGNLAAFLGIAET